MPKEYLSLHQLLDLDFNPLRDSNEADKIGILERLLEKYKMSKIHTALAIYICEKDKIYLQAYPGDSSSPTALRRKYFKERFSRIMPSLKKQTISDYRRAGKAAYNHAIGLDAAGVDIFEEDIIKKLLLLPMALQTYASADTEVYRNFAKMNKQAFEPYEHGKGSAQLNSKTALERYVEVFDEQRTFFGH